MIRIISLFIVGMLFSACTATHSLTSPPMDMPQLPRKPYEGPDFEEVDLLRTHSGGPRIFVQARLPDDSLGLFMVDTGAAISTMSEKTAERIGLKLQRNFGTVEGLGGTSGFHRGVMSTLGLNNITLKDVDFAVGVRGIPEHAHFMPLDGILGNNVWSHFVMEVDYPSDTLALHRPGTVKIPGRPTPMMFDGSHVFAEIVVHTDSSPVVVDKLFMEVDTGAGDFILSGASGSALAQTFSEGVEPIYGIGASEYLPSSMFLQTTRRIPLTKVRLGGRDIKIKLEAKWLNFATNRQSIGPSGMRGLIGHRLLHKHRVWFDYQGARFSMTKSKRTKRQLNGHQRFLDQDIEKFGEDPKRLLFRSKMLFATGKLEEAIEHLESYLTAQPSDAEARVLLAKVRRSEGDLAGAWKALGPVSPESLVEQQEIIAAVNGLLLEQRNDEALALARKAAAAAPDKATAHIALADAYLGQQAYHAANRSLLDAARVSQNPDANLLRRARVALAQGDRHGAMAKVRRLIQLYPTEGTFLWFYSTLLDAPAERRTFRIDMQSALQRLHPTLRPFDFMVAAHHAIGDDEAVNSFMKLGIERDCSDSIGEAPKDNCLAWYHSLARKYQTESLDRIQRALELEGDRSDFLDTRAMVYLSRGELDLAWKSAVAAARMNPDDVYMLWQAERISQMAKEVQ